MSGELDFLVLAPYHGFFCIEVKHGGISRKNGEWCFTDKQGNKVCKKTGPFVQQSKTMNSIRKYVIDKVSHNKELKERFERILWGSGVAFTSMMEFTDFGPEGHSYQVLTKQALSVMPIGAFIETLSNGCHNEHSNKSFYDIHGSRPTVKDCETMLKILRGDFEIDYSELNRLEEDEALIEQYTREQFELLDFINYNQRCLIEGAAGTGKTLMALEVAKRKVSGNNIGLFCFNSLLGENLSSSTIGLLMSKPYSFCGSFHKFLLLNSDLKFPVNEVDRQKYFTEDLPIDFILRSENLNENDKFDFLVLDEAQDLLSPYYMEVFNLILKGGLKSGNWIMFGDFSNQAIYLNKPEDIWKRLNQSISYTRFPPLRINCRNTKMIAKQNTLFTGVEMPQFRSSMTDGKQVVCKYPSKANKVVTLEAIILDIDKRGIPMKKVTLLSPQKIENTIIENSTLVKGMLKDDLKFSTIQSYKGLENSIIILLDFDEISSEHMQKLLYIGVSRAKQELYVLLDQSLKESATRLIAENFSNKISI